LTAGLDTSVVIRLLTGEPEGLAAEALRYLVARQESGDRVLVSDLVLAESYFALQHHYGVPKKDSLAALRALLVSSGIECLGSGLEILQTPRLGSAKPGFVDRLIHRTYERGGIDEMATFEKAAAKLSGVCVLSATAS
jgi:predicted nucleic acid-binding protein